MLDEGPAENTKHLRETQQTPGGKCLNTLWRVTGNDIHTEHPTLAHGLNRAGAKTDQSEYY